MKVRSMSRIKKAEALDVQVHTLIIHHPTTTKAHVSQPSHNPCPICTAQHSWHSQTGINHSRMCRPSTRTGRSHSAHQIGKVLYTTGKCELNGTQNTPPLLVYIRTSEQSFTQQRKTAQHNTNTAQQTLAACQPQAALTRGSLPPLPQLFLKSRLWYTTTRCRRLVYTVAKR